MDAIGPRSAALPRDPENSAARLKKACRDFESLFVNYLLKAQGSVAGADSFFSQNHIVRSMFNDSLSQRIADGGGLGIGDVLFEQFREQYGAQDSSE